jgi:hypothetical protein
MGLRDGAPTGPPTLANDTGNGHYTVHKFTLTPMLVDINACLGYGFMKAIRLFNINSLFKHEKKRWHKKCLANIK